MSEDQMLKCLISFVLGFLFARMIRGNGMSVGCDSSEHQLGTECHHHDDCLKNEVCFFKHCIENETDN